MSGSKNISSVEMMRGIAAMMVAYFHIARGNPNFLDHSSFVYRAGAYGWAGVEIFFVISGFIIMYAMFHGGYTLSRVHKFLAKRLIRLEPPYIASIVVVLILMYVSTLIPSYRGKPFNPDWWNVLGHLGYVNAFTGEKWLLDVYWSLAIEFEFYIGLAVMFPLLVNQNKWISWLAMCGLLFMTFIPTHGTHVFAYLPFFAMGILLSLYRIGKYSFTEFFVFLGITIALCAYKFDFLLLSLGITTIVVIHFLKTVPKPLAWLGKISYSLYLLHMPIGGRIVNFCETRIQNHDIKIVVVFIVIAVCLVCSHLFYKIVEKPFQKLSKKMTY